MEEVDGKPTRTMSKEGIEQHYINDNKVDIKFADPMPPEWTRLSDLSTHLRTHMHWWRESLFGYSRTQIQSLVDLSEDDDFAERVKKSVDLTCKAKIMKASSEHVDDPRHKYVIASMDDEGPLKGQYVKVSISDIQVCIAQVIATSYFTKTFIAYVELDSECFDIKGTSLETEQTLSADQLKDEHVWEQDKGWTREVRQETYPDSQVSWWRVTNHIEDFVTCKVSIMDESKRIITDVKLIDTLWDEQKKKCRLQDLKGIDNVEQLYQQTTGIPHLMDAIFLTNLGISKKPTTHVYKDVAQDLLNIQTRLHEMM